MSNTQPDLEANEERRMAKAAKDVRKTISGTTAALFHPDLDLSALLANVRRFFDDAPRWNFPIGQNQALRIGYTNDRIVPILSYKRQLEVEKVSLYNS